MTISNSTLSPRVSKSTTYPISVNNPAFHQVAEDPEDYSVQPLMEGFLSEVKRYEIQALRTEISAQIGRLFRLADLLLDTDPANWPPKKLEKFGMEMTNATHRIEDYFEELFEPLIDKPKSEDHS